MKKKRADNHLDSRFKFSVFIGIVIFLIQTFDHYEDYTYNEMLYFIMKNIATSALGAIVCFFVLKAISKIRKIQS